MSRHTTEYALVYNFSLLRSEEVNWWLTKKLPIFASAFPAAFLSSNSSSVAVNLPLGGGIVLGILSQYD